MTVVLLSPQDVSERLRRSIKETRKIMEGMERVRVGARWMVTEAALERWIMEQTVQPGALDAPKKRAARVTREHDPRYWEPDPRRPGEWRIRRKRA